MITVFRKKITLYVTVENHKTKYPIVYLIIFLLYNNTVLSSKSIYRKQINNREIELEFDMYYTALGYYLPLTETAIPYTDEKNELKIYKKLLASPLPRFLVLEVSSYPMPCLGVFIKKQFPQFYNSMDITDNLNLVKSGSAGFEEPYAVSVFLGNVIGFKPSGKENVDGKGYMGLLVSGGNYHIKDNESIGDNWIEGETEIKR